MQYKENSGTKTDIYPCQTIETIEEYSQSKQISWEDKKYPIILSWQNGMHMAQFKDFIKTEMSRELVQLTAEEKDKSKDGTIGSDQRRFRPS